MKRLMTAVCMATLMGAVAVAAQTPMHQMDKDKMATDKMGKPITVTGCVAAGKDAEHFKLTDAVMTGEETRKSYDLMGGELKAHLGHKVAVTGTLDTMTMPAKDKMAMGKDKMAMGKDKMPMEKGEHGTDKGKMAGAEPHTMLHVTSVKMIASSCP